MSLNVVSKSSSHAHQRSLNKGASGTPKQTTAQGKLLTAIAMANGHNNPDLWAAQVGEILAKLEQPEAKPAAKVAAPVKPKVTP